MDDFERENREESLFSAWVATLIAGNYPDIAALIVDGSLELAEDQWSTTAFVNIPALTFPFIVNDPNLRESIEKTLKVIVTGHLHSQHGPLAPDDINISLRVKLISVENDWRERVKQLIVNSKDANQAQITGKVFAREAKEVLLYNEMKFGSQSEIHIAQELEKRKVLFFPLPLAVRHETGKRYLDHREVDFLVCDEGTWGILEVAYHPNRWEEDSEKDLWFKKSGILCIHHATAEKCYNHPAKVVNDFLAVLAQHKK